MKTKLRKRVTASLAASSVLMSVLGSTAYAAEDTIVYGDPESVEITTEITSIAEPDTLADPVTPQNVQSAEVFGTYSISTISDDDTPSSYAAEVTSNDTTTGYSTLAQALSAADTGDTVTLLTDVTEGSLDVNKAITLELSDHKITSTSDHSYTLYLTADTAIYGGAITGATYGVVVSATEATLSGTSVSASYSAIHIQKIGSFEMTSGSLSSSKYGIYIGTGSNASVTGGAISGDIHGVLNYGTLSVSGTADISTTGYDGIYNSGTATVSGGKVSGARYGILGSTNSDTKMTGGEVTGTTMGIAALSSLEISGGSVSGQYGVTVQGTGSTEDEAAPAAYITGGTITGSQIGISVTYGGSAVIGTKDAADNSTPYITSQSDDYAALYCRQESETVIYSGTLTGLNTGVTVWGDVSGDEDAEAAVSTVTINGGKITAENGSVPARATLYGKGATLNVNGGEIIADAYAIAGNGQSNYGGTSIDISGGTITSTSEGGCAIYHPQAGNIRVDGRTSISGSTGIQFCSGEGIVATILDGTITASGDPSLVEGKTGDGCVPDGSAISILNRGYPGGEPVVNISSGTFISEKGNSISAYTWSNNESSTWSEAADNVKIYGGTFSDIPEYIVDGYGAAKKSENRWLVGKKVNLTLGSNLTDGTKVTYTVYANTEDSVSGIVNAVSADETNAAATYSIVSGAAIVVYAAAEGYNLKGWALSADIEAPDLSTGSSFAFTMGDDLAIYALFTTDEVELTPTVTIAAGQAYIDNDRYYVEVITSRNIPEGYSKTVTEHGIKYGFSKDSLNYTALSSDVQSSNFLQPFNMGTNQDNTLYVQGYIVVTDADGSTETITSEIIAVSYNIVSNSKEE